LEAIMSFGCWTPLRGGEGGIEDHFELARATLQKAEALGFETSLVAERFIGAEYESWVLASALSQHIRKMELIVAVHPGILSPQVTAKMGATLDNLTQGRCAINIVNGWWREEMDTYGNGGWLDEGEARYRRMDEFLTIMTGLWTQPDVSLEGTFYQLHKGRLPQTLVAKPHPRIYAASRSDLGKEVVARHCQSWFVDAPPGHRQWEENFATIEAHVRAMDERCARLGRKLDYTLNAAVLCADSTAEAQRRADALEERARDNRLLMAGGVKGLGGGLVGTPEVVVERLQRYAAIGIDCVMLRFMPVFEGMYRFGAEVIPKLKLPA
jgi:FMNH2-dependent dimethyl sulfone monooxygenase